MRFGKTLQQSLYEPWREHYLDYAKLKSLLREQDAAGADAPPWTDDEEQRFTDELVNLQLDKVNAFQEDTYKRLDDKTNPCQSVLDDIASKRSADDPAPLEPSQRQTLTDVSRQLDEISQEISELEKFARINYTGALKAAKKHDRRRGTNYKVRPLVQVRLAALPCNSEDYSPFLYRLSGMYSFVRQQLGELSSKSLPNPDPGVADGEYTSQKFFVHPDNLLEVKTLILRHLPVLLYKPISAKDIDGTQRDPSITALYFDNPTFELYTGKLEKGEGASSLRIRWYEHLSDNAEVKLEKKTLREGDDSEEVKIGLKDKYVMRFLRGEHKLEKTLRRVEVQKGSDSSEAKELERSVAEIQGFVRQNELEPMLRANYTRTAFQIPGEDRVRISIDTNLTFVREDRLDPDRPCRNPDEWHRKDIDDLGIEYPFESIPKGQISYFPYAVMEVKLLQGLRRKKIEWIEDLTSSHLVKEAPRFSKFLHGVASLFEDTVNTMPFWMSLAGTDIRRDPEEAFQEEQDKKAKIAEDELVVGSLLGSIPKSKSPRFEPAIKSPVINADRKQSEPIMKKAAQTEDTTIEHEDEEAPTGGDRPDDSDRPPKTTRLRDLFPSFSNSRYARARRGESRLPEGVTKPDYFLKDVGEVKVEPKVWLANQRLACEALRTKSRLLT